MKIEEIEVGKCYTISLRYNGNVVRNESYVGICTYVDSELIKLKGLDIEDKKIELDLVFSFCYDEMFKRTYNETPEKLDWVNYCIEKDEYIPEEKSNKVIVKPKQKRLFDMEFDLPSDLTRFVNNNPNYEVFSTSISFGKQILYYWK